jgi:radical SAM protein with 4Fe4S-binding SPASM domain
MMNVVPNAKRWALDRYFGLARSRPDIAKLHNTMRRLHHRRRYGVDSAFMFRAVELEVNSMCNRKCGYCPNSFAKRPTGYMPQELFAKIVDELGEMDFDGRISYHFYGEPLLDKRLPGMVAYSKQKAPQSFTEIYSNGDYLTLPLLREYLACGLDNFLITQHDNEVPENLQRILDQGTEAEKKHVVIRFAKDRNLINRSGLIEHLAQAQETLSTPCTWPLSTVIITHSGNVVLCCNDYFETEVLGSVATHSLKEVWTGERFTRLRKALAQGDRKASKLCNQCDFEPPPEALARLVPPTD